MNTLRRVTNTQHVPHTYPITTHPCSIYFQLRLLSDLTGPLRCLPRCLSNLTKPTFPISVKGTLCPCRSSQEPGGQSCPLLPLHVPSLRKLCSPPSNAPHMHLLLCTSQPCCHLRSVISGGRPQSSPWPPCLSSCPLPVNSLPVARMTNNHKYDHVKPRRLIK